MEYKTVHLTPTTTASEVVYTILSRFRMRHRDPNLFYLALEVVISKNDGPTSTTVPLSDTARPSALLECQPCSSSRLTLRMRRGGVIRIHDALLAQGSQYKSLLVSGKSDCLQVIGLVLACNHLREAKPNNYVLIQVTKRTGLELRLLPHDRPLAVIQSWPTEDHAHLHIRPAVDQPVRPLSTAVKATNLGQSRSSLANELESYLTKDFLEEQRAPNSIPDVVSLEARLKHMGKPSDTRHQFSDSNGAVVPTSSCLRLTDDNDMKNIYEICGLQAGDSKQRNEHTEDEANHLYSNGEFLEKAGMIAGRCSMEVGKPPSPPSRAPRVPSRRKGVWSLNPDLLEDTAAETDFAKNRRTLCYNDYENYFYI
ncbi:Ras-associating (RA) domain [Trinorchestia longiramus]|nr:Ras-associating (RA) domain [Trinorchestia longiramus]